MTVTLVVPVTNNTPTGYIAQPVIANAVAIRDTSAHDPSTDATMFLADLRTLPGSRVLYVNSTLNQSVTLTLQVSVDGTTLKTIGSAVTVASSTVQYIDASNIAQLAQPFPYLSVQAQCGSSPASGTLTIQVLAGSAGGGGASSGGGETTAVTQSGTWTVAANAGTNLNTSLLALETGGNLATLAGAISANKYQVSGTVTSNAGTNLNTSLLALETGGNLATLAGAIVASRMQAILTAVNATSISAGATGPTVIKGTPGTYFGILVSTVGAGAPVVYDNASAASGTIVGAAPASAVVGLSGNVAQGVKCAAGITVSGGATMPAMTIYWT